MARTIELTNDEELNQMAEDLGFNPDEGEATRSTGDGGHEHPISIDGPGDIMKCMNIVKGLRSEIEQEKNAMEEELNHIRDFREQRIEQKQESLDYLTQPLQEFISKWGENYNGPAGHAGYHTVTTTNWKADADQLVGFAQRHGLRQKLTIKADLSADAVERIKGILEQSASDYSMDVMAYKSSIKGFVKEANMDSDDNALYEKEKRKDFRMKPE